MSHADLGEAAGSRAPLVRCVGAARTYGLGTAAVVAMYNANCAVYAGQQIALMGPSGSGKSTLIHVLAGLDTPTTGAVCWPAIGNRDQLRPGPIGVVFQGPSLLPPLDVLENVALPLLLAGHGREQARAAALAALARLDLASLSTKLPEELSGGQAQRVAIARVLAAKPQLILADEPTGQLDHTTGAVVIDTLVAAAAESNAGLVISTHDTAIGDRLTIRWSMADGLLETRRSSACSA